MVERSLAFCQDKFLGYAGPRREEAPARDQSPSEAIVARHKRHERKREIARRRRRKKKRVKARIKEQMARSR
jgi:hypothetical protein